MAFSNRNLLGNGGGIKESALEAALPPRDDSLYGTQILGYLANGNCIGVEAHEIIKNLGDRWVFTEVSVGAAGTAALAAATATLPPYLNLNTGTTQFDHAQLQYGAPQTAGSGSYTAWAPFVCKAGYDISFFARVKLTTTVDNAGLFVGLADVDTSVFENVGGLIDLSEAVGFLKPHGNNNMTGYLADDVGGGGGTATTALTVGGTSGWEPTVNVFYDLGFRVQGRTSITFYVNGEKTGTTTMTRLPDDDVALTPTLAIAAGTGAVVTCHVEALSCFQEAR